jgi:CCR4-NOT transcription complex subunit 1
VVERSVTIALITTRELITKDFSYDCDVAKVEQASNLTVKNLAGSLALVTSREPLKMSLSNNIKTSIEAVREELQKKDVNVDILSDGNISDFANAASRENIELGCKQIKNEVVGKALANIRDDKQMRSMIESRNKPDMSVPFGIDST